MSEPNLDDDLVEASELFTAKRKANYDVAAPSQLRRSDLDFSLDSLRHVDTYLSYVRKHRRKMSREEMEATLWWGGAYVGEVIKKISRKKYRWITHADYIAKHPKHAGILPLTLGTQVLLLAETGDFTLPVNKVVRFIEEGPENSVHYYATGH